MRLVVELHAAVASGVRALALPMPPPRGAKPGELPVEQPNRYVFVVNMKTVKSLGLVMLQSLLLRADEVVE